MERGDVTDLHRNAWIDRQPAFRKVTNLDQLNLSSNELFHPQLPLLFREFLDHVRTQPLARYPSVSDAAREFELARRLIPGSVVLAPGSDPALRAVIEALGGSRRLVSTHLAYRAYAEYADVFDLAYVGVDIACVPQAVVLQRMVAAIDQHAPCLVVIANPDATTGVHWSEESLLCIAECVRRSDSLLVVDEAYAGFSVDGRVADIQLPAPVVTVRTLSKSHGAAGLRIATVQSSPELAGHIAKTRVSNGVSHLGLEFLRFAHERCATFTALRADVARWRDSFVSEARRLQPKWQIPSSVANFVYIDTRSAQSARAVCLALELRAVRVRSFEDCAGFSSGLRITIAAPEVMAPVLCCFAEFT